MSSPWSAGHTYVLGETMEGEEHLWTASGLGGTALSEFFGVENFRVTGGEAIRQAASMICLDVLAQDISKATLRLKKKVPGGSENVESKKHPMARMLALDPNRRHTWIEFTSMVIYHLAMSSNSYIVVKRNVAGDIIALVPVPRFLVAEKINETTGEVFYDVQAGTLQQKALLGANEITVPERDMIHIRQRMIDGFSGISTVAAGARTLNLGEKVHGYQNEIVGSGGRSKGVFTRDAKDREPLSDSGFRRLQSQVRKIYDPNNTDPIVLDDGVTYASISMNAQQAEIGKIMSSQIAMTCKLWRMPPHKVMHLESVKYDNLTSMEQVYVRDTLLPICRLAEKRFDKTLLTEKERIDGFYFEYDRDEMAIFDEKAETDRVVRMAERGLITKNEAREDQGYNPVKNGDVYIVPVNHQLIDGDNNVVVHPSGNSNETEEAPDDDSEASEEEKTLQTPRLVSSN